MRCAELSRASRGPVGTEPGALQALRIELRGVVQGVGLRPAVHRLAKRLGLAGSARNASGGLVVEIEGPSEGLHAFETALPEALPPGAVASTILCRAIPVAGRLPFRIDANIDDGPPAVAAPPDRAICGDCMADIDDPGDRRADYPFASCTACGPRYSILAALPYERSSTSMNAFDLCDDCRREFGSPADRRFHAEAMACPRCGPRVWLVDASGRTGEDWLTTAVAALHAGRILALKGLGGYQLLCDATNRDAVRRLRQRKGRPLKPLAVLVASIEHAERIVRLTPEERQALTGAVAPICLIPARVGHDVAPEVANGMTTLGVMLPATPLHALVARRFGRPLVCTSGNREGDPLECDVDAARTRLDGIADLWLHHDRRIVRPVDDSVVRVIAGRMATLRLARGLAPTPMTLPWPLRPVLAVGGHQKAALAWCNGQQAVLGEHIGDLESLETRRRFEECSSDAQRLYRFTPELIVHDAHPDYASSRRAAEQGIPTRAVHHHHAHVVSAMVELGWLDREILGVAWDGTGLGPDGTIWGGEFLRCTVHGARRVAHVRPFRLPGGEAAIREPWRVAAVLLRDAVGPERTLRLMARIDARRVTSILNIPDAFAPMSTSAGRLFDAAACLLLAIDAEGFDGRPAMLLEGACDRTEAGEFPLPRCGGQLDWRPTFAALADDLERGLPPAALAMRFHRALARGITAVCAAEPDCPVVLTGGVFQNRILTELVLELMPAGRVVGLSGRIPANDGGLAAGQLAIAMASRIGTQPR